MDSMKALMVLSMGLGAVLSAPAAPDRDVPARTRFDPRKRALDIETVDTKIEDDLRVTSLYFTSHAVDGRPVRIYGVYARIPGGTCAERPRPVLFFNAGNDFFASLQTSQELMQADGRPPSAARLSAPCAGYREPAERIGGIRSGDLPFDRVSHRLRHAMTSLGLKKANRA